MKGEVSTCNPETEGGSTKFSIGVDVNFFFASVLASDPSAILDLGHSDSSFVRKSCPLHQSVLSLRREAERPREDKCPWNFSYSICHEWTILFAFTSNPKQDVHAV